MRFLKGLREYFHKSTAFPPMVLMYNINDNYNDVGMDGFLRNLRKKNFTIPLRSTSYRTKSKIC